ncbi:tRNA (adenosine(37)-N6)-threonylcarbamoyltransferase complex ATPase subunit type 1 TsaE [Mangrovibacterium lignilyticum]|uniref:tRNA (adenosine(37)-N6)-threonylcarbamoyltransferase complex ATPase subunit type 1 TsaE n=1 Tax=Mangrovibacterium lignilyticum TaxID=2668052 RepID=UPI0013D5C679|nr:tRNA (adenosine(37)-N6)-threonylcarbamoyltransferase complex ATPase subunit type 1 TsaE [Mangrovibacterium lignilyticum]
MFSVQISSLEELPHVAKEFLKAFGEERLFAFYGSMGAGKTTFIKALCRSMGSTDNITSPTFALVNEYDTSLPEKIYHFDFYRLKDMTEAMDIGFDDYVESGNYCFMEWPEKIERLLPDHLVEVHIEEISPTVRRLKAEII